jgi:hypothetical protein
MNHTATAGQLLRQLIQGDALSFSQQQTLIEALRGITASADYTAVGLEAAAALNAYARSEVLMRRQLLKAAE